MKKSLYLFIAIMSLSVTVAYGQKREKHKSYDKFVWYSVRNGDCIEAQTKQKEVIIPMSVGCKSIEYDAYPSKKFFVKTTDGYMGVYEKDGTCVISPTKYKEVEYKKIWDVETGDMEFYFVMNNGAAGVCDSKGNEIISPEKYTSIQFTASKPYYFEVECSGKEGICDLSGKEIIAPDKYESIVTHSLDKDVYFSVKANGRVGICDKEGREIFGLTDRYSDAYMSKTKETVYFRVKIGDKDNGVCDINGNEIIAPGKYDQAYLSYSDGVGFYYSIKKGEYYGICSVAGVETIPPVYNSIIYSSYDNCFQYKSTTGKWVSISSDFSLEDAIAEVGDKYRLVDASGNPLNKHLYDLLTYLPEQSIYSAVLAGYTTLVRPDGTEHTPIGKQIFEEAYNLPDTENPKKYELYNLLLQVDPDNTYGYNASTYNNLGVIFRNQGNDDMALSYYNKCLAISPDDQTAKSNIKAIKSERRAARWNAVGEALGNLSQALDNAGAGSYYNQGNANYNVQNSPSDNNNTRNYQASYDIWAKQAERLYNKLTDKNGYTGSSKTRTVDVNAFHRAQREMRNISMKAANAGKPVQKSVYQSKVIH